MSKLFTIFGATGQQGGAIIQHFLKDPELASTYRLRGVTRDATQPSAVALKEQGVEIVEADMDKPETLEAAMKDSDVVFAMTNYWESSSPTTETTRGKALASAALSQHVPHLIWSSLPANGIPHFNSKALVEDYIRSLPITSAFFMPGWFMQNFVTTTPARKVSPKHYILDPIFPGAKKSTQVPLIDIRDTGKFLGNVIRDPKRYQHERLFAATGFYSLGEICETWSRETGVEVVFGGEDGGDEEGGLTYYGEGGEEGVRWTIEQADGELMTWEGFVRGRKWFDGE